MKSETLLAVLTVAARVLFVVLRELSGIGTVKRVAARRRAPADPKD
jgi:hypothetical protein